MIQSSSSTDLDCSVEATREARRLVADSRAAAGVAACFPGAELLVSELVTNSVRHTDCGQVRLDIDLHHDEQLRLAVIDADPAHVPARDPSPGADGGHGLRIVNAVADDWGVEVSSTSKVIWVELHGLPRPSVDHG